MAVEALRREAPDNPILVTGTSSLAKYLRASKVPDPNRIFSYEELLANLSGLRGRFSVLIVDEGQQITTLSAFEMLGQVLDKPLQKARWRWFSDPNHQLSSTSSFDGHAQEELESWCTVSTSLRENCRNTPQIVQAIEFVTGAGIGSTRVKGSGPDVAYSEGDNQTKLVEEAAAQVIKWTRDGEVSPSDIVLLSGLPLVNSSIPAIAAKTGLGYKTWQAGEKDGTTDHRVLRAATIEEFRGLEAPFVVLCDLQGDLHSLETNLYLGMTRANFGLFIACSKDAREKLVRVRLKELADKNSTSPPLP